MGQGGPEPPSRSHLGSGSEGGPGARGPGGHHRVCRFLHLFRPCPLEQGGLSDLEATKECCRWRWVCPSLSSGSNAHRWVPATSLGSTPSVP